MTGSRSLSTGLRTLRPAAFGADPEGERLARIRRSPNFANGSFQNPSGAGTRRFSGSAFEFAKRYFRKEERAGRTPAGRVPVHATTLADLARPPASGLRVSRQRRCTAR